MIHAKSDDFKMVSVTLSFINDGNLVYCLSDITFTITVTTAQTKRRRRKSQKRRRKKPRVTTAVTAKVL